MGDEVVRKMTDDMVVSVGTEILGDVFKNITYGIVPEDGYNIDCICGEVGDRLAEMFIDPDNTSMTIDDAVEVCKFIGKHLCKNSTPAGSDFCH